MPLYSYKCNNCGIQFDAQQKFTDKPLKRCPECSRNSVKRVIQPAGIIFKGSGWYKTDSQSSSSSTSASPSKSKKSEAKSTDSASSDSKPAESKPAESKASASKSSDD